MESQFHTVASLVWVWANNEQGWLKGTVNKVAQDGKLQIAQDDGKIGTYKPEDCPLRNVESRMGVEVRTSTPDVGWLPFRWHYLGQTLT
jgi:hypothetical protein